MKKEGLNTLLIKCAAGTVGGYTASVATKNLLLGLSGKENPGFFYRFGTANLSLAMFFVGSGVVLEALKSTETLAEVINNSLGKFKQNDTEEKDEEEEDAESRN